MDFQLQRKVLDELDEITRGLNIFSPIITDYSNTPAKKTTLQFLDELADRWEEARQEYNFQDRKDLIKYHKIATHFFTIDLKNSFIGVRKQFRNATPDRGKEISSMRLQVDDAKKHFQYLKEYVDRFRCVIPPPIDTTISKKDVAIYISFRDKAAIKNITELKQRVDELEYVLSAFSKLTGNELKAEIISAGPGSFWITIVESTVCASPFFASVAAMLAIIYYSVKAGAFFVDKIQIGIDEEDYPTIDKAIAKMKKDKLDREKRKFREELNKFAYPQAPKKIIDDAERATSIIFDWLIAGTVIRQIPVNNKEISQEMRKKQKRIDESYNEIQTILKEKPELIEKLMEQKNNIIPHIPEKKNKKKD